MKLSLPLIPTLICWSSATLLTLGAVFLFYNYRENKNNESSSELFFAQEPSYYQMYNFYPKVLGATIFNIVSEDAIPILVEEYLKDHQSPMLESSNQLVEIARKYDLDPLLLVAIAQCESNLGKKMPENCHNPFGWGIHKSGTLCFNSWEEGYEAVSKGLKLKYIDQGLKTPEEIMTKYNETSLKEKGGAWAKCVSQFISDLKYAKTKLE
jgi:hypothetical protein